MAIYSPVVFDFDGTMLDSNAIKEQTFYSVVGMDAKSHESMRKILERAKLMQWDRFKILGNYAKDNGLDFNELVNSYNEITYLQIIKCEKRLGIEEFLSKCRGLKFINSATPTEMLRVLVKNSFPNQYFDLVLGDGAAKKVKNLEKIIKNFRIEAKDILVFGDSNDDYEAANLVAVGFMV